MGNRNPSPVSVNFKFGEIKRRQFTKLKTMKQFRLLKKCQFCELKSTSSKYL